MIGQTDRQRGLVVVGAGRSGTSALTRGLQALGVELGGRLKPGNHKNAKGFFEDEDFITINYRLRDVLGFKRAGDGVSIVPETRFREADVEPIFNDAVALIRERFGGFPIWGFKAGGVLSFLPFWERVFEACDQEVSYVVALRNPLSVAQSRARVSVRRGLQENSDLEFLARVVPYFRRAARSPLSVVDYDCLMTDAENELTRVAEELDVPLDDSVRAGIRAYADEFLNPELRHHSHGEDDLYANPRVVPLARDAYLTLRRLATGEIGLASDDFWGEWSRIEDAHSSMAPALSHIDSLEMELRRARLGLDRVLSVTSQASTRIGSVLQRASQTGRHLIPDNLVRGAQHQLNDQWRSLTTAVPALAASQWHDWRGDGEQAVLQQARLIRYVQHQRESMYAYERLHRLIQRYGDAGLDLQTSPETPQRCLFFVGYSRSGHSLVGSLLDAHPHIAVAHEQHSLKHLANGHSYEAVVRAIEYNSQIFQRLGRHYTGYDYSVPGQFQGDIRDARIVGDKKGNATARLLRRYPDLMQHLDELLPASFRFVHVIRNPFDTIASKALRTGRSLVASTRLFFANADVVTSLRERHPDSVIDLFLDDLLEDPRSTLENLVTELDMEAEPNYLQACSDILFDTASRTGDKVTWPDGLRAEINERLHLYPFLARFAKQAADGEEQDEAALAAGGSGARI